MPPSIPTAHAGAPGRALSRLDAALDELDRLPPLGDARFLETHRIFEANSEQRRLLVETLCDRARAHRAAKSRQRVLAVGCGSGDVDVPLARTMSAGGRELEYVGVDPNREECAAMQRLFDETALPGVRLEVEVGTFEGYHAPHAFDLVHFVHSLYYMEDPAAALDKARAMLAPGGELVVVQAPCEELNELALRFYDKQYDRPTLFAEDVARLLERWEWDFERVRLEASVDVTSLAGGDPDLRAALLGFIVQVDARALPEAVQRPVDDYLRLIAQERGGRSFVPHPVDVFFVCD